MRANHTPKLRAPRSKKSYRACTTTKRRGDSWKLNDLRALLFGHYARESKATSSPLVIEGFSRDSVKKKMQKMRKVLGDDVMNFATSSTDVEELDAIRQERMQQILHSYNPIALTHGWQAFVPLMTSKGRQEAAQGTMWSDEENATIPAKVSTNRDSARAGIARNGVIPSRVNE